MYRELYYFTIKLRGPSTDGGKKMSWYEYFWKWFLEASPIPIRIVEITVLFLTLAGLAIHEIRPDWVARMDKLAWQIPLGLLISVFVISMGVSSYHLYQEQQTVIKSLNEQLDTARKQAYPTVDTIMLNQYFKGVDIPLGSFGLINNTLKNKTFEDCRINGPVVVHVGDNTKILNNTWLGNPDFTFIITTNKALSGVVDLQGCTFIKCTFQQVSFIGPEEQIDMIKAGFGFAK